MHPADRPKLAKESAKNISAQKFRVLRVQAYLADAHAVDAFAQESVQYFPYVCRTKGVLFRPKTTPFALGKDSFRLSPTVRKATKAFHLCSKQPQNGATAPPQRRKSTLKTGYISDTQLYNAIFVCNDFLPPHHDICIMRHIKKDAGIACCRRIRYEHRQEIIRRIWPLRFLVLTL